MPRVLVVEDEPRVRCSLEEGLQGAGFEVETAATGEEGRAWRSRACLTAFSWTGCFQAGTVFRSWPSCAAAATGLPSCS